jgi:soluble lytic murein transglycosylase
MVLGREVGVGVFDQGRIIVLSVALAATPAHGLAGHGLAIGIQKTNIAAKSRVPVRPGSEGAGHRSAGAKSATAGRKTAVAAGHRTAHGGTRIARAEGKSKGLKSRGSAKKGAAEAAATERMFKLNNAFVASAQLRPMAQQLASGRTAAGYAGILSYAQTHPGPGAETAYLALGHAYAMDRRYGDAFDAYRHAASPGEPLSDYSDYLGAQVLMAAGKAGDVFPLLDKFEERHPESIFTASAPILLANALIQQKNGAGAVMAVEPLIGTPQGERTDVKYALGRAYQAAGDTTRAAATYR